MRSSMFSLIPRDAVRSAGSPWLRAPSTGDIRAIAERAGIRPALLQALVDRVPGLANPKRLSRAAAELARLQAKPFDLSSRLRAMLDRLGLVLSPEDFRALLHSLRPLLSPRASAAAEDSFEAAPAGAASGPDLGGGTSGPGPSDSGIVRDGVGEGSGASAGSSPDVPAGGAPAPLTQALSIQNAPGDLASYDCFHIVQWQDPRYNPDGPPGSSNCGPTSLAMCLRAVGTFDPSGDPQQQILEARQMMGVGGSNGPTDISNIAAAVNGPVQNGWDALDAALAAGQPVVADGVITGEEGVKEAGESSWGWKGEFPGRIGSGTGGHFIAVLGKTADGLYIVSDPMHGGGPVAMTRAQLAVFQDPPQFVAV